MEKLSINLPGQLGQSFDPAKLGRIKADSFNKKPGDLTGYDCPKCMNRGKIAILKEDGELSFMECCCMKIRSCVKKMERSGLREVIKNYTFDAYKEEEPWQSTIKNGAVDYANNVEGWLLFCGQSGSGKTHLCTAVCRQLLLEGKEVRYMPWRQDARELKAMESSRQMEEIKKLQLSQVLYIDDLFKAGRASDGSCNPTVADINLAFDIINYRYMNHLPTIISTERSPGELVEIDEALGGRIVELARWHIYCIEKNPGRNYRLRGVVTA